MTDSKTDGEGVLKKLAWVIVGGAVEFAIPIVANLVLDITNPAVVVPCYIAAASVGIGIGYALRGFIDARRNNDADADALKAAAEKRAELEFEREREEEQAATDRDKALESQAAIFKKEDPDLKALCYAAYTRGHIDVHDQDKGFIYDLRAYMQEEKRADYLRFTPKPWVAEMFDRHPEVFDFMDEYRDALRREREQMGMFE